MLLECEDTRPLGRRNHIWEYNIKTDLTEMMLESVDWVHLDIDTDRWRAFVYTAMNLRFA
jgi:hypothetical protein